MAAQSAQPTGSELVDQQAPEFSALDPSGEPVSLSDFEDRPVLLVFSSPTCKFCAEMYPRLRELETQVGSDVQIVMLQIHSDPESNRQLTEQQDFGFPVLVADESIFASYRVPATPFSLLLDSSGKVVSGQLGGSLDRLMEVLAPASPKPS